MRYVLLIVAVLLSAANGNAQDIKNIQLKQERVGYAPKGYYIAEVVDDRSINTSIGTLRDNGSNRLLSLDGGAAKVLNEYISDNVPQDKKTQAASLHITKLSFDVSKRSGVWNIDADIMLTFYVADKKLIEYTNKGQAQIDTDPAAYIESFIRQAIGKDVKQFDEWWAQNKGGIPVASAVKVNVQLGRSSDKPENIVYSLKRQLTIEDFMGRVNGPEYEMAVTSSGIGVSSQSEVRNSQMELNITITPYFNKSTSWFKPAGRNTHVLVHEQTHFDITAIKACELIAAIRNARFTQDNYLQLLEELQVDNSKECNAEEEAYDAETNHGTITDKQAAWEKKITAQVQAIGCY